MADSAIVRVIDLCHAYPDGTLALQGITFDIEAGERVGVVGPNGAGKSSLFLCLCGALPLRSGQIRLADLDLRQREQRKLLPQHVGIVFQNSDDQLFCTSVEDDVAFGPLNLGLSPAEARVRVDESLRQVGLAGHGKRVPQHLSGGEKRRVALAGVLAMRPSVLLLDEPSIYLDPRGRRELIGWLDSLTATLLIASHDLEFVLKTCQRVLVLAGGKLVADGPVRDVLSNATLMDEHGLEVPTSLRNS